MSEKNWMPEEFEFDEFEEIFEEKETLLGNVRHIKEIPICTQETVVLPYEKSSLKVSEAVIKRMISDVEKSEILLGIVEREKGETILPAVGSIGVAADIEEDGDKLSGKSQIVKIQGIVRFTIDEYVETDKPYPVARITFFEDDKIKSKWEKQMHPVYADELRKLMKQFCRLVGKYRHMDDHADTIKNEDIMMYSFFFWFLFAPVPQEIRRTLIEVRSTVQRTFLLNRHLERVIKRIKKTKRSHFN